MTAQNSDQFSDDEDFAALLEQSLLEAVPLKPGEKLTASVLQVGSEWVFLDVGQKGEGVITSYSIHYTKLYDLLDAGEINRETYLEMRAQLGSNNFWSGEIWNRHKDGSTRPIQLSVTAVRNLQNQITHFVSIMYDISARKAAERALVEMDRMKSEFISSAAHELRTSYNFV